VQLPVPEALGLQDLVFAIKNSRASPELWICSANLALSPLSRELLEVTASRQIPMLIDPSAQDPRLLSYKAEYFGFAFVDMTAITGYYLKWSENDDLRLAHSLEKFLKKSAHLWWLSQNRETTADVIMLKQCGFKKITAYERGAGPTPLHLLLLERI